MPPLLKGYRVLKEKVVIQKVNTGPLYNTNGNTISKNMYGRSLQAAKSIEQCCYETGETKNKPTFGKEGEYWYK